MKVIILAGGKGTRLAEYTKTIPKPMVKIGRFPILIHIINHYLKYGFNEIFVAAGYKNQVIKKYFKNFKKSGRPFSQQILGKSCNITIADTGLNTLTGGRLKRMKKYLSNGETFMFTYGDGICDVNLTKLLNFHKRTKKITTVTSVHPPARFGEIIVKGNIVKSFKEKPQTSGGWINGGFFVFNNKIFDFINSDFDILEKKPLEKISKSKNLAAFKHEGFWKCMDTIRDRDVLREIYKKNNFNFK